MTHFSNSLTEFVWCFLSVVLRFHCEKLTRRPTPSLRIELFSSRDKMERSWSKALYRVEICWGLGPQTIAFRLRRLQNTAGFVGWADRCGNLVWCLWLYWPVVLRFSSQSMGRLVSLIPAILSKEMSVAATVKWNHWLSRWHNEQTE